MNIPEFSELLFDEGPHVYRLDGVELPSVTTIMKPLSDNAYSGINMDVLNNAAARGTAVHTAIEFHAKYGIEDIQPELQPYLDAYLSWFHDHSVVPIGSEIRLYHKTLRYAGTADMIAEVDGEPMLVDFKTSASVKVSLGSMQLEAYNRALESHNEDLYFVNKAIIHLKKDGRYNMIIIPDAGCDSPAMASSAENWNAFMALLRIRNFMGKYK